MSLCINEDTWTNQLSFSQGWDNSLAPDTLDVRLCQRLLSTIMPQPSMEAAFSCHFAEGQAGYTVG